MSKLQTKKPTTTQPVKPKSESSVKPPVAPPKTTKPQKAASLRDRASMMSPSLPAGTSSPGLTNKSQASRRGKQYKPHKDNLKSRSQWWKSIKDPLHGAACKIPDDVGVETGTLQCVQAVTFNAATGADGGVYGGINFFSPYPGIDSENPQGKNYQFMNSAETGKEDVQWLPTTYPLKTNVPLNSYAQGVRIVSAALMVEPEASLASASGEMTLFLQPWAYDASGVPLYDYQNLYQTAIMPLNRSQPMQVAWFPVNFENSTYTAFYPAQTSLDIGTEDEAQRPWALGCIVTGCPTGTTFRCSLVVNYEFLPKENTIDILSAQPSRVDVVEQDLVESWIASEPKVVPLSSVKMNSSPLAVPEAPDPTGFGMFADVIKELAPYALEGLSLLL